MRIAVSASAPDSQSPVDSRFGRAPYFMVYDTESETWEAVANAQNANAAQGAGVQSAQLLAQSRVCAVLTGHCGPKAFRALEAGSIAVYSGAEGTVEQALGDYRSGKLSASTAPDVEGHW